MAIIFIDDKIRGQLANSIRFTRDIYIKPSNILLAHPNGVDYIVLKNRHYYNHEKQISPSDISEYTKLNVNSVQYAFLQLGFFKAAKVLNLNGMNLLIDDDFLNPNGKKILKEMVEVKFKVGDKVVPISKSIGISLEDCPSWCNAKKNNQPFLYVTNEDNKYYDDKRVISCSEREKSFGDHFLPEDLTLYVEDTKGEITPMRQYAKLSVSQVIELIDAGILKRSDTLLISKLL